MMKYILWYGRINRQKFILIHIGLIVLFLSFMNFATDTPSWSTYNSEYGYEKIDIYPFALYLLVYWVSFCCTVQRLHDLNKSGFNYLWFAIPFVNLYWAIRLIFEKSDPDSNKYGDNQLRDRCICKDEIEQP